jgi:hypothetical protein
MNQNVCYSKAATLISGRRLALFCGAGISRDAPARAPLWNWLRDTYIATLVECLRSAQPNFLNQLSVVPNRWESAKPEVMCEILYRKTGEQFFDSLNILALGQPNSTHRFLARLSRHGMLPWILTTNFDEYVEDALVRIGSINVAEEFGAGDVSDFVRFIQNHSDKHYHAVFVPEIRRDPRIPEPKTAFPEDIFQAILFGNKDAFNKWRQEQERAQAERKNRKTYSFAALAALVPVTPGLKNLTCVAKLHGTLSAPRTIVATLVDAAKPLPPEVQTFMARILADFGCLFVGYSGRDHDIYPFLLKCAEEMRIVNPFLWMSGPSGSEPHVTHLMQRLPEPAKYQWNGTAADLCRSLSGLLKVPDDDIDVTTHNSERDASGVDDLANSRQHLAEWAKSIKSEPTISSQNIWIEGPGYSITRMDIHGFVDS